MADLENNPSDPKSKPESSLQEDMNEGKGGNNPQEGMNVCLSYYTYC